MGNRNRDDLAIDTSPDELDRIQHASERDHAIRSLENTANRLRDVRTALRRMDAGTFGICIGCDEIITPKRLAALPWASYCIICQEATDREQQTSRSEITALGMVA
jgi:DnaK suppressor protein